jgi:hypothetical protein
MEEEEEEGILELGPSFFTPPSPSFLLCYSWKRFSSKNEHVGIFVYISIIFEACDNKQT